MIFPPYIVAIALSRPTMRLKSAMLPMKGDRTSYSQQQPNKNRSLYLEI